MRSLSISINALIWTGCDSRPADCHGRRGCTSLELAGISSWSTSEVAIALFQKLLLVPFADCTHRGGVHEHSYTPASWNALKRSVCAHVRTGNDAINSGSVLYGSVLQLGCQGEAPFVRAPPTSRVNAGTAECLASVGNASDHPVQGPAREPVV